MSNKTPEEQFELFYKREKKYTIESATLMEVELVNNFRKLSFENQLFIYGRTLELTSNEE